MPTSPESLRTSRAPTLTLLALCVLATASPLGAGCKSLDSGTMVRPESATQDEAGLPDLGPAPEFKRLGPWINSPPLTLAGLRGSVVLVDFWTLTCTNCVNTLPAVTRWHDRYASRGLVIVGIHAPEFAHERELSNVREAVAKHGLAYPVAIDNAFATWKAYDNRYWPSFYFIDKRGHVRHAHFGEGSYDSNERIIRALLAEAEDVRS